MFSFAPCHVLSLRSLAACNLSGVAGEAIGQALLTNTSLQILNLEFNKTITEAGWIKIAEGVAASKSLQNLNVVLCGLSDETKAAIQKAWNGRGGTLKI